MRCQQDRKAPNLLGGAQPREEMKKMLFDGASSGVILITATDMHHHPANSPVSATRGSL